MLKFLNKFINVLLVVFIVILILNALYVVQFSTDVRNVFIYLALITMLFNSVKDLTIGKNKLCKFLSSVTFLFTIFGGVMSILNGQFHILIYICVIFSLINSTIELVSTKG